MCRKYILGSSLETIKTRFNAGFSSPVNWNTGKIVSPGDETIIITQQNPREIILSSFGMTPAWSKQPQQIINARAEGDKNPDNNPAFTGSKAIFLKPAFQKPLFFRRCIVIADAFIEWSVTGTQQPYLVFLRDRERPFAMAGIYEIWINPATLEKFHTFAIITVPGNKLLHKLPYSRMPVILEKGRESRWLKPDLSLQEILGQLQKFPSTLMNAYPISEEINKTNTFSPGLIKPCGEKLLSEARPQMPVFTHYHHKVRK
jgi:putative SOS response-associated peptidase YedK